MTWGKLPDRAVAISAARADEPRVEEAVGAGEAGTLAWPPSQA